MKNKKNGAEHYSQRGVKGWYCSRNAISRVRHLRSRQAPFMKDLEY
jgi:hypothetical protein